MTTEARTVPPLTLAARERERVVAWYFSYCSEGYNEDDDDALASRLLAAEDDDAAG